ncbi:hypothetical protein [Sphingorhabdus sp.]|uniref:hypothetical protein n=1 Tax=Sphingorhabdus sp. TaxID=1902408 RepID=UPI003918F16F
MNISRERLPRRRLNPWRVIGWGGAIALILAPLVAMQFTNEVDWDETDFIVATIIFGIVGGLIELAVRVSSNWYFRIGAMFAVLAGFMVVWANLAVGMIGNEDNPVNLWFGAVLFTAIAGSIASRFRGSILPWAMFVAGTLQIAIGTFAGILGTDMRGGRFTIVLSVAWFIASLLFWSARRSRNDKV